VAIAEGVDPEALGDEPEHWWSKQGRPEPRYDTLLAALASTDAARRSLLGKYFDPPPDSGGPILPTRAHRELAWLCMTGRVRLIITTNFDRMIERALDQAGISAQVITTDHAIDGMIPLQHAPVTVLKLHGDYASGSLRNTPEELSSYPPRWNALLARVFDEYGLLIVGWSAEYDIALGHALEASPSRRYPVYWTSFNRNLTEAARRLISFRQATVVETAGADEFLADLTERIKRLDEVAARRTRASLLRTYAHPVPSVPMPGWQFIPLLQLRAVAVLSPASIDTCGLIRPEDRDRLVGALRVAPITMRLRYLSERPPASAAAVASSVASISPPLIDWEPTPDMDQSTEQASYRLGGDAATGISTVVNIRFPGFGRGGNSVVFTMDVGISLQASIRLADAALIWRDALVLTGSTLPTVLASILPAEGEVGLAEIHAIAQRNDGKTGSRTNDISSRLDLSSLGNPSRSPLPDSMGIAARVPGPLTERDAAELVADAIEVMSLDRSYLDPRVGINALRNELGLTGRT
jgi:hypothetical protein